MKRLEFIKKSILMPVAALLGIKTLAKPVQKPDPAYLREILLLEPQSSPLMQFTAMCEKTDAARPVEWTEWSK